MTTAKDRDRKLALTAYELATSGDEITFERFARMVCKTVTFEAGKRAFYRFAEWALEHGVEVKMKANAGSFDPAALRALSNRIRLSPGSVTSRPQGVRTMTTSNQQTRPFTTRDERITIRQAARMIGLEEAVLARRLRRDPPLISFLRVGRAVRLRVVDVVAFVEANTVGGKK